jgi:hypothetical protein
MNTWAHAPEAGAPLSLPVHLVTELKLRQPELAAMSQLFLLATLPCLLAVLIDTRTVNDVSVWIKPVKFLVSLSLYYATLAWFFGYLPRRVQWSLAGRFVIWVPIAAGLLEMVWLLSAAFNGVPSHFNETKLVWQLGYAAAGAGALLLMTAVLVQGVMLGRQRAVPVAPAFRHGLVLGSSIAFAATIVVAGYLSSQGGHWVGGMASDAGGLPLFGWSRTGGDLRVAHFWALHAHQLLPLAGWLMAQTQLRHARLAVWLAAAGYLAMIALTFAQALNGKPFIA